MIPDPIVDEIRQIRKAHAAKYNNELDKIVEALRVEEQRSPRRVLNPGPKRIVEQKVSETRAQYGSRGQSTEKE